PLGDQDRSQANRLANLGQGVGGGLQTLGGADDDHGSRQRPRGGRHSVLQRRPSAASIASASAGPHSPASYVAMSFAPEAAQASWMGVISAHDASTKSWRAN